MNNDNMITKMIQDKYGVNHPLDMISPDYEAKKHKFKACQKFIDSIIFYKSNCGNKIMDCGFIDNIPYMLSHPDDKEVINEICKYYSIIYDFDIMTGSVYIKSL